MRVCGVCGEVYGADERVCAVDGEPLRTWANTVQVFATAKTAAVDSVDPPPPAGDSNPDRTDEHPPAVIDVPPTPTAGHVLSKRYVLERQLGVGGFGAVFQAQDKRLRKRVAVKILSPTIAQNPEALDRFELEAVAASQIGHHGIIDVTDFDSSNGMYFIVMEYLDGVDLMHAIDDAGHLAPVRALRFAAEAADAISAAHAEGILHRDLKPPNLYVTKRPDGSERIKVIDFGISKIMHQPLEGKKLTSQGQVLGTPYYMAPEQASGEGTLDGRCDVYSLGIILYEMVTGETPFDGDTYLQLVTKHLTQQPEPPSAIESSVPPEVDEVILKALEKAPDQRFESMQAFRDRLTAVADALDAEGRGGRKTSDAVAIPRTPRDPPNTTLGQASGQMQVGTLDSAADPATPADARRSAPVLALALAGAVVVGTAAFFVLKGGGDGNEPNAVGGDDVGVVIDAGASTVTSGAVEPDELTPDPEPAPTEPVATATPDAGAAVVDEPKTARRDKKKRRNKRDKDKDNGSETTDPPPADPPPDDDFLKPARDDDPPPDDDFLKPARE